MREPSGDDGSRTTVVALAPPAPRGDQVRIEDNGNAAEQVVAYLAERKLL